MGTAIAGDKLAPGTGMHVGRELAGCTVPWECLVALLLGPWALWTATAVAILSSSCPDAIYPKRSGKSCQVYSLLSAALEVVNEGAHPPLLPGGQHSVSSRRWVLSELRMESVERGEIAVWGADSL